MGESRKININFLENNPISPFNSVQTLYIVNMFLKSAAAVTTTYFLKIRTHILEYTHLMFINLEIAVCIVF